MVFRPGFTSVSDFHLNCSKTRHESVAPVEGGREAVLARFEELDLLEEPVEDKDSFHWNFILEL